ncbi:MAG: aldo/keto reductase [Myxococcota bacterium]|jgi:aryl-alcohol dehydrogenase-like predicted oxidoreductase|nr:aldo/keto reductase [Myxococcota bacterium]
MQTKVSEGHASPRQSEGFAAVARSVPENERMRAMRLGKSGFSVSRLVLGTMTFGDGADETVSRQLFARAREAGIDHFDCADLYANGQSEEILGRLIKDVRNHISIASKAYFPRSSWANARGASRYHLRHACEQSLRRLQTDRIEVYYIHRFDDDCPLEESLRALEDLQRDGLILYAGVSNFAAWQVVRALGLQQLHGWAPLLCIQPMYNLLKRQAEVELLPMAKEMGLGVIPYSPTAAGMLSGRYGVGTMPSDGRIVRNERYRLRYGEVGYLEQAQRFVELATEMGVHPAALAIAWVLRHPAVSAPILGVRTLEHLETALGALEIKLDDASYARLCALTPTPPPATDRNEERAG